MPLLFILLEISALLLYKHFYYYQQYLIDKFHKPAKDEMRVILIDRIALFFIVQLLLHLVFLVYCVYLMFSDRWQPGCMLLLLASIEAYAVRMRIDGVTTKSSHGFIYPTPLFKYFISTLTIFILLHLL